MAFAALTLALLVSSLPVRAGDAPSWMHALVNAPLPEHDEKTNAVLLLAEDTFTVQGNGKMKRIERRVYKILRPDGRGFGTVYADFDAETKINSIHGWCIPSQGKDYEVKDKDAIETALFGVQNGELMSDQKTRVLAIPAADPGNLVGYEIEQEVHPYVLQNVWRFQLIGVPVREAHYTLQLPPGWEYRAVWLNHPEVAPSEASGQWQWALTSVPAVKPEGDMPPLSGVAGRMIVSLFPPGGSGIKGFESWNDVARWEDGLDRGRRDASPEIKQRVATLTASSPTTLAKMQALARFVQTDIRYVAIELGIGGFQAHAAADIFNHHYGDCKDKAMLLGSMLHEIGVESFHVSINTKRGGAAPDRPPTEEWFNHEILAIKLPQDARDPSLIALFEHPKLGRILIFDPTDEWTPFGSLRGDLQANYGLLVADDGGELIKLPLLPAELSGVVRTARLALSPSGTLSGDFIEQRKGDYATQQRSYLKSVPKDADRIKFLESLISQSLPTFQITKASLVNLNQTDQPFGYQYSLVAQNYAKTAGNLLLVRPRVVGSNSSDLLETKESRKFPVEFDGPRKNSDTIEIAIPAGYEVDDLPPPVNADYSFASYHSKTEISGNTLKYTRTFEVKELSVPVSRLEDLKKLYRIIASDERNTAVLRPAGH
ncbi:MAG TPA: DUF3857 domain-containing protein [Candidatus Acidoferrum sp.]|nr:DUF3857 domain-containing protein [Candidatus Acidoferrum sp.]